MVRLYVKGRREGEPCAEVSLERVEGMVVEDLLAKVARKTNVEQQELRECIFYTRFSLHPRLLWSSSIDLMYGGCILKTGETLDKYHIADGCTLHIMHRKKKGRTMEIAS